MTVDDVETDAVTVVHFHSSLQKGPPRALILDASLSPRASIRLTTMVTLFSSASVKQMSLRTSMQSLGLNNSNFPSASSILKRSIHKPISNTLSLSSKSTQNGSMDKPAFSIHNPDPASSIPNLSISNQAFINGNSPPWSIRNEPMALNKSKSALNNPTVDAIAVPKGWSNTRLVLPYVCHYFEPEEYGLPPLNPILGDDADSRFLLEAGGNYYLYNPVSDILHRFDQPTELSSILSALDGDWKNIKITEMELL